jgi:hypothetical protein
LLRLRLAHISVGIRCSSVCQVSTFLYSMPQGSLIVWKVSEDLEDLEELSPLELFQGVGVIST